MECDRCGGDATPVQPVDVDGEQYVEIACPSCGTYQRARDDLVTDE